MQCLQRFYLELDWPQWNNLKIRFRIALTLLHLEKLSINMVTSLRNFSKQQRHRSVSQMCRLTDRSVCTDVATD